MRKFVAMASLLGALAFGAVGFAGPAGAQGRSGDAPGHNKVAVCVVSVDEETGLPEQHTIHVPAFAAESVIADNPGSYLGDCVPVPVA